MFCDFKLSPCCECCILSLGDSPASEFYVPNINFAKQSHGILYTPDILNPDAFLAAGR